MTVFEDSFSAQIISVLYVYVRGEMQLCLVY